MHSSTHSQDGLAYFSKFGVDPSLFQTAFDQALCKGADWADLYFEHRTSNHIALQDGAVNQAFSSVSLGVGIRVIKGDQTGYSYTEDLSKEAIVQAASSAALIADMPSSVDPIYFEVKANPTRYSVETQWNEVRVDHKIPLLSKLKKLGADDV